MISRVVFVLVIWMSVSALGGCAAFRWGDTQPPVSWPLSKGPAKQSISLVFTAESFDIGTRQEIGLGAIQVWERVAAKAYKESGLFSDVKIGAAETDLRAEVHLLRRAETDGGLVWFMTLMAFPLIERNEFVIRTTVKNKDGQELGAFENKDGYTELDGPLLIFLMPFKEWPETIFPRIIFSNLLYDLHRATLSQAHHAGLFQTRH